MKDVKGEKNTGNEYADYEMTAIIIIMIMRRWILITMRLINRPRI